MKIVVVGDIHGHNSWKKILETEEAWNKVIFLGDYVDSFTVSSKEQRDNFLKYNEQLVKDYYMIDNVS